MSGIQSALNSRYSCDQAVHPVGVDRVYMLVLPYLLQIINHTIFGPGSDPEQRALLHTLSCHDMINVKLGRSCKFKPQVPKH